MPLYEVTSDALQPVEEGSFIEEGVKERSDLQQWLIDKPEALGERLFVITEEFCEWSDSRRRIDLLALDENANLVVIELKRTEDGGHMDLQAIRYAAMISSMTLDDVVNAHARFLQQRGQAGDARERIHEFLGIPRDEKGELTSTPRIILVSRDFSLEITTTVLWLVDRGIDIKCVQAVAYKLGERLLLDFRQVLPLQEAGEYQVKIRAKDETLRRTTSGSQRERTLSVLVREGLLKEGTEIEIIPNARPDDWKEKDPRTFKARVVDLRHRESVQWLLDEQRYSTSKLTVRLSDEHGTKWLANNIFIHWRIVGDQQSMWDRAEALTRGERFSTTSSD